MRRYPAEAKRDVGKEEKIEELLKENLSCR
jgi:hypothetical protein